MSAWLRLGDGTASARHRLGVDTVSARPRLGVGAARLGVGAALLARGEHVAELREDGVLSLGALLLAEGGERALLVGRVDLVLLADAHSLHAPVPATPRARTHTSVHLHIQ